MFSGYIPTSNFFSDNNLEYYSDPSAQTMKIGVFNLVGAPYNIKGISEFRLQNDPSMLNEPTVNAEYASHNGLGMTREQNHFLNTNRDDVTYSFIMTDTYEGTPHATISPSTGGIVRNDFANLFECASWLKTLAYPIDAWKKPPYVRFSLGRYSNFGIVTSVGVSWLKLQSNAEALIARVDIVLKQDTLNFSRDKAFFEVSERI